MVREGIMKIYVGTRIRRCRHPTCGAWEIEKWKIPNRMNRKHTLGWKDVGSRGIRQVWQRSSEPGEGWRQMRESLEGVGRKSCRSRRAFDFIL